MAERQLLYFAYGSCMSERDFRRTIPEFERLGKAVLPGHRVAFTLYAESRMGGVADIVAAEGEEAEGVLYRFPAKYLFRLDDREGVHDGHYRRFEVEVLHEGKPLTVWTYEVVKRRPQELAPSKLYRDVILEGADVLSDEYREKLKARMAQLMGTEAEKQ